MSGEVYFDFKVKPSKKRDPKKSDQDSGEDGTNRVMAVARELRRATAKERTGPRKIRSPEAVAKAAKSRKDHEAGNASEENPYYRGLDRNVWKLSDYANTSSLKEEPIARETSPSWEDYVPDYSSRRESYPLGYKSRSKNSTVDSLKYSRKKYSRSEHTPRNWKGIHSLSPAVLGDSEEYVPKKSPGSRKSRRNNQMSTLRSVGNVPYRNKSKHSIHHSSHRSKRHRLANSATSEIEVNLGADEDNSLTDLDMEPYPSFQQQGLPEEHNIPVGAIPAAAEPKVQCQAFYKNTGSGSPTIKEILVEMIWWSVLGVALMLVLTYRSSLPPLSCNTAQPLPEAPPQQQTTVPL